MLRLEHRRWDTGDSVYVTHDSRSGLTGGIASGKSTISKEMETRGAVVLDADKVGHEVYLPGTEGFNAVRAAFGDRVVGADGEIDRRVLGSIVFGDPADRKRLEGIVWPVMKEIMRRKLDALRGTGTELVVLEAADVVYNVLAATANPENPSEVNVTQPSDTLTAEADAKGAFNGLFLGLGAVALLVGAIGVANIMIISVLERRSEIGLAPRPRRHQNPDPPAVPQRSDPPRPARRRRRHRRRRARHHDGYTKHWTTVIPTLAWGGGIAAAILIGAVAGLLPAIRAARLAPTDALRTA